MTPPVLSRLRSPATGPARGTSAPTSPRSRAVRSSAGAPDAPGSAGARRVDGRRCGARRSSGVPSDDAPLVLDRAGRLYLRRYWAYERALAARPASRAPAAPAASIDDARCVPRSARPASADVDGAGAGLAARRRGHGGAAPPLRHLRRPGHRQDETVVRIARPARAPLGDGRRRRSRWRRRPARRRRGWRRRSARRRVGLLPAALRARDPRRRRPPSIACSGRVATRPARAATARDAPARRSTWWWSTRRRWSTSRSWRSCVARAAAGRRGWSCSATRTSSRRSRRARCSATCAATPPGFSAAFAARVTSVVGQSVPAGTGGGGSPLRDSVVLLRHSRRFTATSGIAQLAAAVNRGDGDGAVSVLASEPADVGWMPHAGRRAWRDALAAAALDGFAPYLGVHPRRCAGRRGAPGVRGAFASSARIAPARRASRWRTASSRTRWRRGDSSVRRAHRVRGTSAAR